MGLLNALIDIKEGKLEPKMLLRFDSEDIVSIEKINKNLGNCVVKLEFSEEQYVSIFYDTENEYYNNSYYLRIAFGNYYRQYDYVFVDGSYMADEDWKQGYILTYFNDENIKKLREILKYISPKLSDFKIDDDTSKEEVSRLIGELFSREIDYIGHEYATLYDDALVVGMKEYVKRRLCDKLSYANIIEQYCASKYFTTVNFLIKLWEKTESTDDDNILEVLRKFIKNNDLEFDEDLAEDYYSYYDYSNFDSDGFNREVERQLDKIFDSVYEDKESYEQNVKIMDILFKYNIKFDNWNEFPSQKFYGQKNYDYKFHPISISDGELSVAIQKKEGGLYSTQRFTVPYDELNNFLLHPEFDF